MSKQRLDPVAAALARELSPTERMSAKQLCDRCKISHSRLRYLKQLSYVSPAKGRGRGAYYTEEHVRQVQVAEYLKPQVGTLTKIAKHGKQDDEVSSELDGGSYEIQRVFTLSTGIKIVIPEVLGEIGMKQLQRLLAAGKDGRTKRLAALAEQVLSDMKANDRQKSRPRAKAARKRASPLPSVER